MPNKDLWLLPQHDYPAREALPDATLHGRREATFLVLVAMLFVATTLLLTLGTTRMLDLSLVAPDLELPFALHLPLGVLAFPLGLVAVNLTCELYGRRRANVLVIVGTIASLALVGCMRAADMISGSPSAFGPALALASCYVVAHVSNVLLYDYMRCAMTGRQRWLRMLGSTLLAQMGGWAAFAFVMYAYATSSGEAESVVTARVVAIAAGACVFAVAFAVAWLLPGLALTRSLAVYLRAGRFVDAAVVLQRKPKPVPPITIGRPAFVAPPAPRVERKAPIHAFSSAEMQFFTEGDALAESPADSGELARSHA
jgi:uncharacterized PurR-regulated membrane protein YhhQ (DUF165 family)